MTASHPSKKKETLKEKLFSGEKTDGLPFITHILYKFSAFSSHLKDYYEAKYIQQGEVCFVGRERKRG